MLYHPTPYHLQLGNTLSDKPYHIHQPSLQVMMSSGELSKSLQVPANVPSVLDMKHQRKICLSKMIMRHFTTIYPTFRGRFTADAVGRSAGMQSCLLSLSEGMEFLPLVCQCEVWTRQERLFRHSRPLDRKSRKVAVLITETTAARWFSCNASSTATELLPQLRRGVLHQLQPLNLLPNFPNCFFF